MENMNDKNFEVLKEDGSAPIKMWNSEVGPFDPNAVDQLRNVAKLPFIHKRGIAAMPDCHLGCGATIGSVIPTVGAIIPAAVGVDIGCGMMAVRLNMTANDLPDNLADIRSAIEAAVPHGRSPNKELSRDVGSWGNPPSDVGYEWNTQLQSGHAEIIDKHPKIASARSVEHLGTLGTGNHFIEVCLDTDDNVWIMLHSGSRGIGNRIGSYFIQKAKQDMKRYFINVPDVDLSYLCEGTENFNDYCKAVSWAQKFAQVNRSTMMWRVINAMAATIGSRFKLCVEDTTVECHHNYIDSYKEGNQRVHVTRKGAVDASKGRMGIIPGSMGAKSYIVRGLGNRDSHNSCSHGAGRVMSRTQAKRVFTVDDHVAATEGIECRKDADVVDETPGAYKDIDAVMASQTDLVEVVAQLRQVVCVKG